MRLAGKFGDTELAGWSFFFLAFFLDFFRAHVSTIGSAMGRPIYFKMTAGEDHAKTRHNSTRSSRPEGF